MSVPLLPYLVVVYLPRNPLQDLCRDISIDISCKNHEICKVSIYTLYVHNSVAGATGALGVSGVVGASGVLGIVGAPGFPGVLGVCPRCPWCLECVLSLRQSLAFSIGGLGRMDGRTDKNHQMIAVTLRLCFAARVNNIIIILYS